MKNEKIINALNKINPDIETKDKMLKNINCKIQIYRREQKEDKFMVRRIIFISVCITLICVSTAFAAYKYFTGGQVAYRLGDEKLSSAFDLNNDDFKIQSETIGDYKATLLGITSGKNISDFKSSSWDVIPERTYIVMFISSVIFTISALVSVKGDLRQYINPVFNFNFIVPVLILSIFCSVVANVFVNYAAGKISVAKLSTFGTLTTIWSMFAGVLFLNEPMTVLSFIGSIFILIGIWQVTKAKDINKQEKNCKTGGA